MNEIETVKLRNGTEELRVYVSVVQMTLNRYLDKGNAPGAFYDLVQLSRDPGYELNFGPTKKILLDDGLVEMVDGKCVMHQCTRNIVLACTEDDGDDIRLVSPVAK